MIAESNDKSTCSLCGAFIEAKASALEDSLSMDHVPPKQFYPKELRTERSPNLWLAPAHWRCNERYRKDEEYFYHAMYFVVNKPNRCRIHRDFARRMHQPQTPAIIRSILKTFREITKGGIHLPDGIVQFSVDKYRAQRVVIKIAQGLFYLDYGRYMPSDNCVDIRLCVTESDIPEFYTLSWQGAELKTVCHDVFSYRIFEVKHLRLFSMCFWESVMFCAAFKISQ